MSMDKSLQRDAVKNLIKSQESLLRLISQRVDAGEDFSDMEWMAEHLIDEAKNFRTFLGCLAEDD